EVRRRVAQRLQPERVLVRDDLDLVPVPQGMREVHLAAVHQADDGVLGKPGADLLRQIADARSLVELDLGAIRNDYLNGHGPFLPLGLCSLDSFLVVSSGSTSLRGIRSCCVFRTNKKPPANRAGGRAQGSAASGIQPVVVSVVRSAVKESNMARILMQTPETRQYPSITIGSIASDCIGRFGPVPQRQRW